MAKYNNTSPYAKTGVLNNRYLGYLKIRPIPASSDDIIYEIEPQFAYRPDLLSYVLYDTSKLWWVFAQRNMDIIKDPIFDFEPGIKIYLPQGVSLKTQLGL